MTTSNVEQLVSAGLVDKSDLTEEDQKLINELSGEEIAAIISAGTKIVRSTTGERVAKVSV